MTRLKERDMTKKEMTYLKDENMTTKEKYKYDYKG